MHDRPRHPLPLASSREDDLRLLLPLFDNWPSVLIAHLAGLALSVLAATRLEAPWPWVMLMTGATVMAVRCAILWQVHHGAAGTSVECVRRWVRPYQVTGLAWSVVAAVRGWLCLTSGDALLGEAALLLMLGVVSHTVTRVPVTPRFVLAKIVIWMSPSLLLPMLGQGSSLLILWFAGAYLVAMVTITLRHVRSFRDLIAAEQVSEAARVELAERERALRASQELLYMAMAIGGVGMFRHDHANRRLNPDDALRQIIGLPDHAASVSEEQWLERLVADDRTRVHTAFSGLVGQRDWTLEYRVVHPVTGVRHVEMRSRVIAGQDGKPQASIGMMIDVTERREVDRRITHLAMHDPLTDLPNRSMFRMRLTQALSTVDLSAPFAVHMLDLDMFQEVNDTLGHVAGDMLLQEATERLRGLCRGSDTVARLGGDEFAIIQSPAPDRDAAAVLAQRMLDALGTPFVLGSETTTIGASVGVALAPLDATEPDALLRCADLALYDAKRNGRSRFSFFDPEMDERRRCQRMLEADLRRALAGGELELHYQPLVGLPGRRLRSMEALVRWRHPERGLIGPGEFIPLAEATGMIVPLGTLMLQRACREAANWPDDVAVAVNLTAAEFADPGLVDTVCDALQRGGLRPQRLHLEVTETTMLQDTSATAATLHRLRALGVKICLDDFGTGFSSLSYLQRFRFDKVKIDRSFVAALGEARESLAIVRAVIELCAGLGIQTTAEGVETKSQLTTLTAIGCGEAQGFYFSRPLPPESLAGYFETMCPDEACSLA